MTADVGVVYATDASPNTVVVGGGPNQSYGPPNLLYTVTPEIGPAAKTSLLRGLSAARW